MNTVKLAVAAALMTLLAACGGGGGGCNNAFGSLANCGSTSANNTAPVAKLGLNKSYVLGTVVTLDASGSFDAEGGPLVYKWVLTGPDGKLLESFSTTSFMPMFQPLAKGDYKVSLTVNDGKVDSALVTSIVKVTEPAQNAEPVANPGIKQNVLLNDTVTLDGSLSSDPDPDGAVVAYKWRVTAPDGSVNALTGAKPTFIAKQLGIYTVSLVVSDGLLDSVSNAVLVTVSDGSVLPVANAGADQVIGSSALVKLDGGSSTGANSNTLSYQWTILQQPPSATPVSLSSRTDKNPTFTPVTPGVYLISLTVTDGFGKTSDPDGVVVSFNTTPVARIVSNSTLSLVAAPSLSLNGSTSTDSDGDQLKYTWKLTAYPATATPAALASAATTPQQATLTPTVVGVYVVTLTVNDGKVDSPTVTVPITVTP